MFAWKTAKNRPAHRRHPLSAALLLGTTTAAALLGMSAPAQAAGGAVHGSAHFSHAWQSTVTRQIHVHGAAVDPRHPHLRLTVGLFVNGKFGKKVVANDATGVRSIGRHGFSAVLHWPRMVHHIRLAVHENGHWTTNRYSRFVVHRTPKGEKIVSVARHYVGSAYVYGADGPHAFDCSGYAMFVYRKAHVASLPHNSEAQRHARRMHRIARRFARPGDLVFYMSGGSSYHVAIYAGHGMQYSATDPAQGVEHDRISSRNVVFGTDWH